MAPQREQRVAEAGRAWAESVRKGLRGEGRRASGGWPGTLSEARTRTAYALGGVAGVSEDERSRLAHVLYNAARESWLDQREPPASE